MRAFKGIRSHIIGFAACAICAWVMMMTAASANPNILALKGATIYVRPEAAPIRDGVIVIEHGAITAVGAKGGVRIPAGAETLDCSGLVITAGLWNAHVHFFERKWADAGAIPTDELNRQLEDMATRFGFTSVFDLSSNFENTIALRDRIERGEVVGPRIRTTGSGMVAPGGLPPEQVLNMMGLMKTPLPEIADAQQAENIAKQLLDDGADGVKLFAPSPGGAPLPDGAIDMVVAEAHANAKPVFIHPSSGADVLAALKAGVDVIGHTTPHSGKWNDAIFGAISESTAALTPTLSLWTYFARHDRAATQDKVASTAVDQLRGWIASDGVVLFGTDLGANEYDPSNEYELMARAGMDFAEILASLTTAPAAFFGEAERLGTVEVGREADLVILGGDPANEISALTDVRYTIRSGRIIYVKQ